VPFVAQLGVPWFCKSDRPQLSSKGNSRYLMAEGCRRRLTRSPSEWDYALLELRRDREAEDTRKNKFEEMSQKAGMRRRNGRGRTSICCRLRAAQQRETRVVRLSIY
jgi:hypothetical protein